MSDATPLAVIIPANNEADWIEPCLRAVLASRDCPPLHVVVSTNACSDDTAARAEALAPAFAAAGHRLDVVDSPEPGKVGALNRAEADLPPGPRVYLDADVLCDPALLGQLARALDVPAPRYATGRLQVVPPRSWATRAYARFWQQTPFVRSGAAGAGFLALNAAGRARWQWLPQVISDDTLVRWHFAPDERIEVPAVYHWPMAEGFRALIRVRRRQDRGVAELRRRFPDLARNEAKPAFSRGHFLRLAATMPLSTLIYTSVALAVRLGRDSHDWARGR